jgi:hypothetical protein
MPTARTPASSRPTSPIRGPAAIVLLPAGNFDSNGYLRSIFFMVKTANGATLSADAAQAAVTRNGSEPQALPGFAQPWIFSRQ